MLELVLGGARSGKSSLAVARARASGRPVDAFIIVDCLTLWIANVLLHADGESFEIDEAGWTNRRAALIEALPAFRGDVVLVSNEVGLGIVPESAAARRFRDEQGRLDQELAALCDRVTFVAAGLPRSLK